MNHQQQLTKVKPGDTVVRWFYGLPMRLLVTEVTTHRIICGPREFCRLSGAEIDEGLGLGPGYTISHIEAAAKSLPQTPLHDEHNDQRN